MKFRSLSREWRIARAPRPTSWDRRDLKLPAVPTRTQVVEANNAEIQKLYRRLERAAEKFWPKLGADHHHERVSQTVCEAMERMNKGEKHTISWWAKYMWGTSVTAFHKNKEDTQDATADDLWAGSVGPTQENYVIARQTLRLCNLLPEPHRTAILMRADGANPIEIADETEMTVDRIIDVLNEARTWLSDGGSYLSQEAAE